MAESLYAPLVVLTLLLAYRLIDQPTLLNGAALGAVLGLATLTRSEGALLLLVLAGPIAWRAGRDRWRLIAAIGITTALVLSPWLVRNWLQFDRFPLLSSNGALTQGATNCRETYYDERYLGFVFHQCALRSPCLDIRAEIPQSECFGRRARAFVGDNLVRAPVVAAVRVARLWNLYRPGTDLAYGQVWAREKRTATAGMAMYALLRCWPIRGGTTAPSARPTASAAGDHRRRHGHSCGRLRFQPLPPSGGTDACRPRRRKHSSARRIHDRSLPPATNRPRCRLIALPSTNQPHRRWSVRSSTQATRRQVRSR